MSKYVSPVLLLLLAANAQATEVENLLWCDGCSVVQEIKEIERDGSFTRQKYYYVANLQSKTIHKYEVAMKEPRLGDKVTYAISDVVPEPDVTKAFQHMMDFYYLAPTGWTKHYYYQIMDASDAP